jgi:hypothetical protein
MDQDVNLTTLLLIARIHCKYASTTLRRKFAH